MADDIFDKMWNQLGRIYTALHDGLVPRADDGSRQPVAKAFRETFGLQDTGRLSDTAAMDLRDEADAMREQRADNEQREDRRPTAERLNVEAPPVIEPQSVGEEIRSAIREIGPAITGALGNVQQSAGSTGIGPSDDAIKGDRRTEHEAKVESQLDRIGDGIDRIIELLGSQVAATQEVIAETKTAGEKAEGVLAYMKKGIEILSVIAQLLAGDKVNENPLKAFAGTPQSGKSGRLFP